MVAPVAPRKLAHIPRGINVLSAGLQIPIDPDTAACDQPRFLCQLKIGLHANAHQQQVTGQMLTARQLHR